MFYKNNHGKESKKRIAVFASGAGSNAKAIIKYFKNTDIIVQLICCNKPEAGVVGIANEHNIPVLIIEKEKFFRGNAYLDELKNFDIDFIVLAGFLWKIPEKIIEHFRGRIVNIHPALLPKYGGKGMYGSRVHEAVLSAGELESGITIHMVDEIYDNGDILFQATCPITANDDSDSLASKIHDLEHRHYPVIIEKCIRSSMEE